ncbi:TPA: helix-turn-helix domain-containing protein [Klebsiella pneumoniae]|uniref:helix-turn-helix domain-containing protein n=1 Tax=Klebsiella pneumoniae TaxID=573 RepID=UPI0027FEC280|nr:helix-turn-helix transcriptional regulator [Klebsiella aerogenes]ELA2648277.1 helix-turn-helix transcriptional regulator [Klebsiella pneumoniae]HBQ5113821.1 helix-turn-helix transcriptional regulator [Klebsiella pneumoniae]HBU6887026.1 helix-turn-helix transcriptional regulator [Klebsiella pneumoniae]HCA8810698.1 helix-turn-helix transcriptional regulator [Klebsiella pneumoniae]
MNVSEKLAIMRDSERLNRKQFSELVGIPYSSLSSYEKGVKDMGVQAVMKILQHPRFMKYTMWFMTDQISPESGQIAPALAHFGQDATTSQHSDQKTG